MALFDLEIRLNWARCGSAMAFDIDDIPVSMRMRGKSPATNTEENMGSYYD